MSETTSNLPAQIQPAEKPVEYSDIARSAFGNKFVGESASEERERAAFQRKRQANLQAQRADELAAADSEQPADGLTAAEVGERDRILRAQASLQEAARAIAQKYGSLDAARIDAQISELAKTNRDRAIALRTEFNGDWKALMNASERIVAAGQQFNEIVIARRREAAIRRGRARLLEAVPELASEDVAMAFNRHLLTRYSAAEVENCLDPRPLISEFNAWRAASPLPEKKPVFRPQPAKKSAPGVTGKKAQKRAVKQARKRLQRSGSMADALLLLQTSRRN